MKSFLKHVWPVILFQVPTFNMTPAVKEMLKLLRKYNVFFCLLFSGVHEILYSFTSSGL